MKVVNNFADFKAAVKAGERDILIKNCGKKLLVAFAAASTCLAMGITSTAGVIASAGVIACASAPASGGVSTVLIITAATTIIAIVGICKGYDIEIDWKKVTIRVRKK